MTLKTRVRTHDWSVDNLNARDLINRLDMVKQLAHVPLNELHTILATLDEPTKLRIVTLMERVCKKETEEKKK